MARPQLSMVGLIDDEDHEEREFVEDLIDDIEDQVKALKKHKMSDVELAEKVRISIRRNIYEANPRIKKKFLITFVVSTVIWAIIALLIHLEVVDFYEISRGMVAEDSIESAAEGS